MTTRRKRITNQVPDKEPDEIRELILDFLYEHHKKARGIKAQRLGIQALQQELKALYGLSQSEVASNLNYLEQKGWVKEITLERTITTKAGTEIPSPQMFYIISDAGIDRVEGESRFKKQSPFAGINIGSVQGLVQIGDHNVINTQYVPLAEQLNALASVIKGSALPEAEKVSVIGDIETINGQLAKPSANKNIIKQAWEAIETTVTAHGFANLLVQVGKTIAPLIS